MAFEIRIGTDVLSGFQIRVGSTPPPVTPGRGTAGVATLVLNIADRASTEYAFATDVIHSRSGKEQRISLIGCPRETYMFSSVLEDGEMADLQSLVGYDGAQGATFQIGLTYEALRLSSTTSGTVVAVLDTSKSDWCYAGSRVVLVKPTGAKLNGVVQSFTANTITLDVTVGTFGAEGVLIMPAIPCFLEPEQRESQHAVNAGTMELRARAQIFGNATDDWSPVGAPALTTYTDPDDATVFNVWDRRLNVDDTVGRSFMFGTELVDRGGKIQNVKKWAFSKFQRQVQLVIKDDSTRQWFKKFIGAVAGRQKLFLMPTWKPDLVIQSGDASTGTMVVYGPPTLGSADYTAKYKNKSLAHKWLQIWKADGTVAYRKISDAADNGDGTQDILLDSPVVGAIQMVSFLEKVRFDTDVFTVQWESTIGFVDAPAMVVQA